MYQNPYVCMEPICIAIPYDWISSYILNFEETHSLHYTHMSYFFSINPLMHDFIS